MEYKLNTVELLQLYKFYQSVDSYFIPPLSQRLDLLEYVKKTYQHATLYEAWDKNKLVGIVTFYANDFKTRKAHITSLAILKPYQGKHIATQLLTKCIQYLKNKNFLSVSLEVHKSNHAALLLYNKFNFISLDPLLDHMKLEKILKK